MSKTDVVSRLNRLELLLFKLVNGQTFGLNVLKVKELLPCPVITALPGAHPAVRGVVTLRGESFSVVDLAQSIQVRGEALGQGDSLVVTQVNRETYGFLVSEIDRIIVIDWQDVKPPSQGLGAGCYMNGVSLVDKQLVQIIDIEKVLGEMGLSKIDQSSPIESCAEKSNLPVLVVDDSIVARSQTERTLSRMGLSAILTKNGREAYELLSNLAEEGGDIENRVAMVISDIEMPEMDGYTLTREIRKNPKMANLHVLLHSSINGQLNNALAESVGANATLTKFVPEELARQVKKGLSAA